MEMMFALHDSGPVAVNAANVTAILVGVGLIVFVLVLLFSSKKKKGGEEPKELETGPRQRRAAVPSSKEVFAPLPEKPRGQGEGAGEPWELSEDEDAVPAKKSAEPKAASKTEPKAQKVEKQVEPAKAEPKAQKAEKQEEPAKAELSPEEEKARLEAERRAKKAEEERRAELARQAEARDKALKAEAERAKAEAKAAAEEQARARAEEKKREAAARAEEESKRKAEAERKKAEAEKRRAEAEQKRLVARGEAPVIKKLDVPVKPARVEDDEPARTLRDGLGKTRREGFIAKLGGLFAGKQLDQDLMDEVEEALFTADIGVRTADRLLQAVKDALSKKELKDASKVWDVLRGEAQKILEGASGKPATEPKPGEPKVTMVLGVNGTGKTTSIGKLAHKLVGDGKKVTLVAGDTFRAAAAEQLEHWARRVDAVCIRGKEGADPASVVFDGVKQALDDKAEFVLVDTAGRLHNNVNLMEELKKVRRVMGRAIESAPHEVLMVLDATTGQNGITQAKLFKEATDVTGIILTKLDGTAKGGVVLGVCDELKIPIRWIGVGERVSDLRAFDPAEFVDELFAPPT